MKAKYDIKKVNRFNVMLTVIFSIVLTLQAFILSGSSRGFLVLTASGIPSLIAVGALILKVPNRIMSILIPLCILASGLILMAVEGGSPKSSIIIMGTFSMATLYFDRVTLVIYGIIANGLFLFLNFGLGYNLLGADVTAREAITQLTM